MSDSAIPRTVAHQAPLSMGFSRQEYWSGLPFPSPGDLPHPGIKPRSPTFWADSLLSESSGDQNDRTVTIMHSAQRHCTCSKEAEQNMLPGFWCKPFPGVGRGTPMCWGLCPHWVTVPTASYPEGYRHPCLQLEGAIKLSKVFPSEVIIWFFTEVAVN